MFPETCTKKPTTTFCIQEELWSFLYNKKSKKTNKEIKFFLKK